jgi:hypothetical protein
MTEGTNIAVLPPPEARPALTAGARPQAIVPTDMDSAYRLAKAVCMAGMAPKGLDTPEKAMVAILHGLEIGLTPMAALQRIAVVNGRPTLWGDGAMSLVRASGVCEYISERAEGTGDALTAICEAKRRGEREPIVRTFSVADAKRAGLWGKGGPWQQYPTRMLAMRARAFCLRDGFADVLGGMYLREEFDDAPATEHAANTVRRASAPPPPPPPPAIEHKPAVAAPQPAREPEIIDARPNLPKAAAKRPGPPPPAPHAEAKAVAAVQKEFPGAQHVETRPAKQLPSPEELRAQWEKAAAAAPTIDALNDAYERIIGPHENDMFPPDVEDAVGIFRRRERELEE